jgi:hypothetical protein
MSTPVMKSTPMAKPMATQAAVMVSPCSRRKGLSMTKPTSKGARKMTMEISNMLDLADLPICVSSRGRSIALSISSIRLLCSRFSASYVLTPVDIPNATELVRIVTTVNLVLGSLEKADPMMMPSITKVESNTVFTRYLRIVGHVPGVLKATRIPSEILLRTIVVDRGIANTRCRYSIISVEFGSSARRKMLETAFYLSLPVSFED